MKCPVCDVELKIYVRQAIEVDYCPQCRGVWLDRGELDKIIDASLGESTTAPPARPAVQQPAPAPPRYDVRHDNRHDTRHDTRHDSRHDYKRYDDDDDHKHHHHGKRKKRGMLGEIFDIFD